MTVLGPQIDTLRRMEPKQIVGTVASVRGLSIQVDDLPLPTGSLVRLECRGASVMGEAHAPRGEVIGFDGPQSIVMLLDAPHGITPGTRVYGEQSAQTVQVSCTLLGRIINGLGQPIDGKDRPMDSVARPLIPQLTGALQRRHICEPLMTGIRAIDGMITLGKGQRVGIFSGPGVGKSTLLSVIARNTSADVNVIALVGERGREVREFIENSLGEDGRARSVLVVATSDESPLMRVRAAMVACTVAEHFRDLGKDVLLIMDSITRFAQAQRQIGLTVGEQPATKGYTPSVFSQLPVLLERAGAVDGAGSITGLYSVLVEGDDLTEPISDAAQGTLDGHLILSRKLAARGHYPAIHLLDSISRVADDVCDEHHIAARREIINLIAAYEDAEELINIGAYTKGSNPVCDVAIELKSAINGFLQQPIAEKTEYPSTCRRLIELAESSRQLFAQMKPV